MAAGGERAAEPEGAETPSAKAGAGTSGGAAARVQGPGLRNVRVNNPARDRHQQDQTTQSETTIAVAGQHVAVGYNDSQHSLLATTQGTSLSGYSWSRDGGRSFHDGGALPNRPSHVNLGDPWMTSDRAGRRGYRTRTVMGTVTPLSGGRIRSLSLPVGPATGQRSGG